MYDKDFVKSRGKQGRTLPAEKLFSSDKILVVRTRNLSLRRRIIATVDASQAYNLNRLSNIIARPGYSLLGLLGVLNSRLFNWLFSTRFFDYEIKPVYLHTSPLGNTNDKQLVAAVQRMLTLHKQLASADSELQRTIVQRQIDATDVEIDRLVYGLYALTAEEIALMENPVG